MGKLLSIPMLFIFTSLFLSCQKQTATSFETANDNSQIKEIPKDWQKIETEDFSFSIPPTMKDKNVEGIDSFVMEFENDEITLGIEYGDYSQDVVSQLKNYEGQKKATKIDGKEIEVVNYDYDKPIPSNTKMTSNSAESEKTDKNEKNFVIGVNFPNAMKSYSRSAISFVARCKTLESRETAEKILYSIKFKN